MNIKIIDALVQNGYIVVENAFNVELGSSLLDLIKERIVFKKAGISKQTIYDNNARRDEIAWLDNKESFQKKYLELMNNLRLALNKELYLGLSYYESHFAKYEKGDFYTKHIDAFKNSKNRVVTSVYYLNQNWKQKDGGELIIYDKNNIMIKKIYPKFNTLVVFLSEKFPHEVKPSQRTRYSIAGWFRVD